MDLKHVIPQQRRRTYGPSFDIAFSTDKSNVSRVGPNPVHSRASSGTFVNENRRIVGKTTSTTSLNPANVSVGGVAVFEVPSGSVVGWLNNSVVSVMEDTDGDDQIGAQRHVTGTLIHKTDTAITLLVTSKVGTTTLSSWSVSYRGLRNEHDPVTGLCRGALIEASRTNLIVRSEDFETTWTNDGGQVAISTNVIESPSGLVNADKISEGTTTTTRRICIATISLVSGTVYAFSCFLKAGEKQIAQIAFGTSVGSQYQNFIIGGASAGTLGVSSGVSNARIESFPNGWYRCSGLITSSTTSSANMTIGIVNNANDIRWASTTGTLGNGIYAWGAQLEAGTTVTSYIPTTAVSAVRAQDLYTITGANFLNMYNQSKGTVFCASIAVGATTAANGVYGFQAPARSDANITAVYAVATLTLQVLTTSFSSQAIFNSAASRNVLVKSALAVRTDDFAASTNGSIATDTSGTLPTIFDRFVIGATGNTAGPQVGNTIFSSIRYYPERLSDAQLQTLTTTVSDTIVYNGVAIWYNGVGIIETT